MKQEHRFVLNPNAMSYNEKSFQLQMSIEEAYNIFGQETYSNKGNYSERSFRREIGDVS
jgi:hypothetical protein